MKVARAVWSRGKVKDNIKDLPIAINMIIEEWSLITKTIGADILVLDMPLLNTSQEHENLVGRFISDIVLQILSFVAQNEREAIRQRQAEGIALAKAKGKHLGRPPLPVPDGFVGVVKRYHQHEITNDEARAILKMTKGTFYRNIRLLKEGRFINTSNL